MRLRLLMALAVAGACRHAAARDGRLLLGELDRRFDALSADPGWRAETVYAYPGGEGSIRSWRTAREGRALWIIAGIHGEEPAGPNALSARLSRLNALAAGGVPVVLLPMCNPKGYARNQRYPNTAERDWRKGGYSVGDSEYLLPDLKDGSGPRAAKAPGPETAALTSYALRLAKDYPPALVIDFHEDELSFDGGYIYAQGGAASSGAIGARIIARLKEAGIPIRQSGRTRFGEPIVGGVIDKDDKGLPLKDGSIDELLGSRDVFIEGRRLAGPAAPSVFVVETPAFAGARLRLREAAQGSVIDDIVGLWELAAKP